MSDDIDYDEMVEVMDQGMRRNMKIVECLDPALRETLGLDEETTLSFSEFALVKIKAGTYHFSVNVVAKEE